jgi:tyrosine-protein phosphatase SIW14
MGCFLWVCAILAFMACPRPMPAPAGGDSAHPVKVTIARHLPMEGVPKFAEVSPTLYRGGQPSRTGFSNLARFGIGIIVDNGRSERNKKLAEQLGMRYVSIPWICVFPKDALFARFLKLVQDNPHTKIFVHCRFGDARTGMMIAAWRMKVQGWTAEEARSEMRAFGFKGLRTMVCPGLASYEKSFPKRLREDPVFRDPH